MRAPWKESETNETSYTKQKSPHHQPKAHNVGLCDTAFKLRYNNHLCSFKNERYRNATELSKHVRNLKDQKVERKKERKKERSSANHPSLQPGDWITKGAARRDRAESICQAPLAAAIRSMYDLGAQHHSQMYFGCKSILRREEHQRKTHQPGWDQL